MVHVLCVILSIRREEHGAEETKLTSWNIVISALRDRKWQFPPMTGYMPVSADCISLLSGEIGAKPIFRHTGKKSSVEFVSEAKSK